MKKPVIQFENFSFQYNSQSEATLNRINLTIYEGEKILIVGPSGSGKSTIANCINGLIPFSYPGKINGSLKVMGKETKDESVYTLSTIVGTVLQDTDGQFIGLSVAEDIAFAMENDCRPQNIMKEQVLEVAKLVDIDKRLKNSPYELSGGQKQRVSLAGVMVDDVNILLFDEPLASLDPATGKQAISLIDEIHSKTNVTVLIIEHRLEDVLHCDLDRIIVVNSGKIVCDMNPNALLVKNILKDCGLREPLYVTALKYAGCILDPSMELWNIESMDVGSCVESLKNFDQIVNLRPQKPLEQTILSLKNISFQYENGIDALKNINLTIKKGEMLSIVGKNGAGKSTLSKLICGFLKPSSGEIFFDGRDMKNDTIKERSLHIGMVMQNPNEMISSVMIYDEVALGLKARGSLSSDEQVKNKVEEVLRICGLYPFRNWPISALSYGQRKRVTIASILVMDPEVILLDEPTAGQDFKHYKDFMDFLMGLNSIGVTIIIITHDMHLMLEYTKRAVVMVEGEIISDDSSVKALTDPDIIRASNLKETSLFSLAVKAGIADPQEFVWKFIFYDKSENESSGFDDAMARRYGVPLRLTNTTEEAKKLV